MKKKDYLNITLSHLDPGKVVIDFGSTGVTGIHVLAIERLRRHFGLDNRPVKVIEPYQMLGDIEEDLQEVLGVDVVGFGPRNNLFGVPNENYRVFQTFWGQEVLMPEGLKTKINGNGDLVVFPEGDMSVPPSGKMPKSGFFFDSIIRQKPLNEEDLNVEDNLEEFSLYSDEDIAYWNKLKVEIEDTEKGIILNPGGTGFGDIALVPAPFLKDPLGIRDITEWYLSIITRPDYIHAIFEKQSEIAVKNLETIKKIFGNLIDVIYLCGTDFGTQESTFCSEETFNELYKPYYQKVNNWIHTNTHWKTFKHSCGAVEPFMELFIDAGFDIINPVQINAKGMDTIKLKEKYGDRLTFWGGGVDTQNVLAFGTPEEVHRQVSEQCKILNNGGGFVFNTVHNIQANTPVENLVAMIQGIQDFNA